MVGRLLVIVVMTGLFAGVLPAAASESEPQPPDTVGEELDGLPAEDAGEQRGGTAGFNSAVGRSSEKLETPIPFTAVGFGIPEGAEVWFRTSVDGDEWTDWTEAPPLDAIEGPDPETAESERAQDWTRHSDVVWVGEAAWLQTSVIGASPEDVSANLIDADGLSQTWTQRTAAALRSAWRGTTQPDTALAQSGQPQMVSRAGWGANESWAGTPSYSSEVVHGVVHHTATANGYSRAAAPAVMRSMYHYHTQTLGWKDLGYNIVIDRYGTVYEGRRGGVDRAVIGAHAGGFNSRSFGVSVIGTYGSAAPPAAAMKSLTEVLDWKTRLHGIDPEGRVTVTSGGSNKYAKGTRVTLNTINGHRDTGHTTCPGKTFYDKLPQVRRDVASGSGGGSGAGSLSVSLSQPETGAHVAGDVALRASASASNGVQYVVFFIDRGKGSEWIGNDATAPYGMTWDSESVPDGEYDLVAVVKDDRDATTATRTKIRVANEPPKVTMTAPTADDRIGGKVPLRADATSAASAVEYVVWFVDGNWVGNDYTAPYGMTWDSREVKDGTRELSAVAVDKAGNKTVVTRQLEVRQPVFSDILGTHEASIERLFRDGVTSGCDQGGRFCPGDPVRRDQMATFLVNASSRFGPVSGNQFSDVPADGTHTHQINGLVAAGITSGCGEDAYCPRQQVTRAQMATFLVRALPDVEPTGGDQFSDVSGSSLHARNINALVKAGVTSGCADGKYCPNAPVTRGQMATFLVKALDRGL